VLDKEIVGIRKEDQETTFKKILHKIFQVFDLLESNLK
jgi:hypothetical protein